MEFTSEARQMVEDQLKAIMGGMSLSGKDRVEVEKELRSSIYTRAEAKASAKGASAVGVEDVKEAVAEERPPAEIATCYTKTYTASLPRAGFWPRLAAYIIDSLVIGVTIAVAVLPVVFLGVLSDLFDYGPFLTAMLIILGCMAAVIALGVVLCYYVVLEGRYGKTVGKHVLGLAVRKVNGEPIGYREALIRNIPKYIRNLLILDALIMLIFFNKEKQRAFDKAADTMVVHMG